ncbi:MAG: sigma-70 family RNA polymerase sigma factor [Elusimicrobia bacterium]|nr:sigma-70 family RNA polymerase sigma factor [Elusimicrobiota bacterium]
MLERGALERFVDEYADHAYAFALSLCGNEPDARELVQEAFVRIFDKADLYDESQPLSSWFLTILKNLFRDGTRRCERRLKLSLDAPIGRDGLTVADAAADPREEAVLDRLEREESSALVRRALSELPPAARAVLTMVDAEGLGYEDAARVLGCPLGTVRSRLNRARALLRGRLLAQEEATR